MKVGQTIPEESAGPSAPSPRTLHATTQPSRRRRFRRMGTGSLCSSGDGREQVGIVVAHVADPPVHLP
jgi:hypothetical protein